MDSKSNCDISMLFQVDTLEGLTFLLNLRESVVGERPKGNDVYLTAVDLIDAEKCIVKITAPYQKEFITKLVEGVGGKKLSDFDSVRAYYAASANLKFDEINDENHDTAH